RRPSPPAAPWCVSGGPSSVSGRRGTAKVLRNGGVAAPSPPDEQALRCAGTGEGMSPSFMKKTMVYLGLLDDEYDEYDDLEDRAPRAFTSATRGEVRTPEYEQPEEYG